jgi:T5SS/PEP-CTERM-associated repeat protein
MDLVVTDWLQLWSVSVFDFGGNRVRNRVYKSRFSLALLIFLLAASARPATASTYYWTGNTSTFSDPNNWTTVVNWGQCGMIVNGVRLICPANTITPGSGDTIAFGTPFPGDSPSRPYQATISAGTNPAISNTYVYDGGYQLNWTGTYTSTSQIVIGQPAGLPLLNPYDFEGGSLTLNLSNGVGQILSTPSLQIGNGQLQVGFSNVMTDQTVLSIGTIQVPLGGSLQATSYLGIGTAPGGTVGSTLVNDFGNITAGITIIGYGPNTGGTLNIGASTNFGLTTPATFTGTGYMNVGGGGAGVLNINGGVLNQKDFLSIGTFGSGTMYIENGGTVNSPYGSLGDNAGSSGTVNIAGPNSQWRDTGNLVIGGNNGAGTGSLNIQLGGIVSNLDGYIGNAGGSSGLVTVGSASLWNNSGFLVIGENGQGTLNVNSGGVVKSTFGILGDSTGGSGTAIVTGSGSQWNLSGDLGVGGNNGPGAGSLTVQAGGVVNDASAWVGGGHGGSGTAVVTGAGSQWNNLGYLAIGGGVYPGSGTFTIIDGGVVNDSLGVIAYASGPTSTTPLPGSTGTVLVSGAGSQWNNAGELAVGEYGMGFLTVAQGGVVTSQTGTSSTGSSGIIGGGGTASAGYTSGTGAVSVTSGGEWNQNGGLRVGFSAGSTGTLTIDSGGRVNDYAGSIGYLPGSIGAALVTGAGSQWNNTTSLDVGVAGTGSLRILNGGLVTDSSAKVGGPGGSGTVILDGATWTTTGTLDIGVGGSGSVTVQDGGILNAGDTVVGSSGSLDIDPSTVNINGNFTLDAGGMLTLDIAGTSPFLYSQLSILGSGLFDGTVIVDFINGFAPQMGDSFDLINTGAGIDFSGAQFEIEGLGPGFLYSENLSNGKFVLQALNNGASAPEPGTLWLTVFITIAFIAAAIRRRGVARASSSC